MFLQWCGEVQAISFYLRSTFGFVGKDAASEAHQFRNTNVGGNRKKRLPQPLTDNFFAVWDIIIAKHL